MVQLSRLLCAALPEVGPELGAVPELEVRDVADDSRDIQPGDVFVAVAGEVSDGHDFVPAAVANGAVAVLAEKALDAAGVPVVVVPDLKNQRGHIAAHLHGCPSESLHCVGVTGTNGKTSVACYLADLATRLGQPAGYVGTIGWGKPGALQPALLTTESAINTQKRLAALLAGGAHWVAMEVSSHALDQGRVAAVDFDVGVFTNLSRDHLDYHGDLSSYGAAKARLFDDVDVAVINADDEFGQALLETVNDARVLSFGRHAEISWRDLEFRDDGVRGVWDTPWGSCAFRLPLFGEFSVANMAAVVGVLGAAGMALENIVEAAAQVSAVPGRVEFFHGEPSIVVDFAHTPDALDKMLHALKPHVSGRLFCVLGCGGDRDTGKRPLMAQVAERHADVVWLTNDNPRSEDPRTIVADMQRGLSGRADVQVCLDRREAIQRAFAAAQVGDLVVVAGKGHENYQEIAGERHPFSDRAIAAGLVAGHTRPSRGG